MPHQPLKRPRSPNALSARSLVILFLATLSVSFMLLLILFQVVFKNIHLQFNTRTPETAPTLSNAPSGFFQGEAPMFQRMGIQSANIQTPGRTGRSTAPPSSPMEVPPTTTPSQTFSDNDTPVSSEAEAPLPTLPPLNSKAGVTSASNGSKGPPLPTAKASASKITPVNKPASPPPAAVEHFELE